MTTLLHDFRFGARMLLKHPGFTLIALLTLAIGIGGSTAIFSIVQSVLLSRPAFPNSDRIVAVWEHQPASKQQRYRVAPANFHDWRAQNQSFAEMAAFNAAAMTLTGAGDPEQLRGAVVTPAYFKVLDVQPLLGRLFLPEEVEPGNHRVVVLSQGVWQNRFGGDAGILDKNITLDGNSYTVVGVIAPGLFPVWPATTGKFSFDQGQQQFWVPLTQTAQQQTNRRSHVWGVIGRLKDHTSIEQAQGEMNRLGAQLAEQHPQFNRGAGILVAPFHDELVGNVRTPLWILFAAVGVMLLVACVNVAGMLLARYSARQKEVAIRAALGAGRVRLIRQFLSEALLLSIVSGALGVWLAMASRDWLLKLIPEEILRIADINLDLRVLGFAIAVCLVTTLLFGLAPAMQAARIDLRKSLGSGRTVVGTGHQRLRRVLVLSQIALAVVLLVGAGLLIRSYERLQQVNPGFRPERMLVAQLNIPASRYRQYPQVTAFYSELLDRVRKLPGVESAALTYDHPLEANWIDAFSIVDRAPTSDERPSAFLRIVSEGYFRSAGVPLLRGREFSAHDTVQQPGAVIVNEAFATQYFANEQPLGKRLRVTTPSGFWGAEIPTTFEIVGVVGNVRFLGLKAEPAPAYYLADRQFPQQSMALLVRTTGDPDRLSGALRSTVLSVDRDQPIAALRTMESLMAGQKEQQRFSTILMGLFGLMSLMLATIGIFGLLSYQVTQQTGEFGLRMAMGARPSDILRQVMWQGMKPAVIGVVLGLLGALALTRLMTAVLFGVGTLDPLTFVSVAVLLVGVALIACGIPAYRATRVEPIVALRSE